MGYSPTDMTLSFNTFRPNAPTESSPRAMTSRGHLQPCDKIMDGQIEGIEWSFGQRKQVNASGFEPLSSYEEALLRWIMHLSAAVLTPMSLPIPGFSLLYESNNQAIPKFALHAYWGRRTGEGLNLRSALAAPGMTTIATEVPPR